MEDDLKYCVSYLAHERYDNAHASELLDNAKYKGKPLFNVFRDLVNTREPIPATDEFLAAQDRMLHDQIKTRGITDPASLPPIPQDDRLSLWKGDITTLAADVIVNAANSQMLGCWIPEHYCIDNAIHTFAGIQLRAECARLMHEQGHPEPTGMAKTTPAYNLPSKWIVHTVGPIANGHPTDLDRSLLANCYISCLEAARDLSAKNIAFCCISTGVFGFPQEQAAQIAVSTVRKWLDDRRSHIQVIFNVFESSDEIIYQRVFQSLHPEMSL